MDKFQFVFGAKVQALQQAITTHIQSVTKDQLCSKGSQNPHEGCPSHGCEWSSELENCFDILSKIQTAFGPYLQRQQLDKVLTPSNPPVRSLILDPKSAGESDTGQLCDSLTKSTLHLPLNCVQFNMGPNPVILKPGVVRRSEERL